MLEHVWQKEPGVRVEGSRALDFFKVQAPGIVRGPMGGYRLFYTAVGPEKPFPDCQGYILSAFSTDGLNFKSEPGIRIALYILPIGKPILYLQLHTICLLGDTSIE